MNATPDLHDRSKEESVEAEENKAAIDVNTAKLSLIERYRKAVLKNPEAAGAIEGAAKNFSYLLPGRFANSDEVSELVYTLGRLGTLFNDAIIRKSVVSKAPSTPDSRKYDVLYGRLLRWLSVIEHIQVLAEMTAVRVSNRARWIFVAVIEATRTAIRGLLLAKYGGTLLPGLPFDAIDRKAVICPDCGVVLTGGFCESCDKADGDNSFQSGSLECPECGASAKMNHVVSESAFSQRPSIGRRTGRMLRRNSNSVLLKVKGVECIICKERHKRMSDFLRSQEAFKAPVSTPLTIPRLIAEVANISRPGLHLLAAYRWGLRSWKPWFLGFILEVFSVLLIRKEPGLSEEERSELLRRASLAFLYALRSPFYEQISKKHLIAFLNGVKRRVPMLSFVIDSTLQYLSVWHSLYYYGWAM